MNDPFPLRAGVAIGFERQEVRLPGGRVRLSALEVRLLRCLAEADGGVVDRDHLLREVWGYRRPVATHAVENAVSRVREKIEEDRAEPRHLLTVQGEGYRLVGEGEGEAPSVAGEGRRDELAALRAALRPGAVVGVWGPPGIGKRWLIGEAAPDAWWVGDAPPAEPPAVIVVDLDALAAPAGGDALPVAIDPTAVRRRARAPRAAVVRVSASWSPGGAALRLGPLPPAEAAALLRERLPVGAPVDPATLDELVAATGGHPGLLVEVADRVGLLPATAVLERLRERPSALLGLGLVEALAARWEGLHERARALLEAIATFDGPAPLDGVGVVAALAPTDDVAPGVAELTAAAWCVATADRRPTVALLAPVRAWVREQAGARLLVLERRHAGWARSSPEAPVAELLSAWKRAVAAREPTVVALALAILDRVEEGGEPALVEAVARSVHQHARDAWPEQLARAWLVLAGLFRVGDRPVEAADALDRALPYVEAAGSEELRLEREYGCLQLDWRTSRDPSALERAVALTAEAEAAGAGRVAAAARSLTGTLHAERGRWAEAVEHLSRARVELGAAGASAREARCCNDLGVAYRLLGRADEAAAAFDAALALARGCGSLRAESVALTNLGSLHSSTGRLADAEAAYLDALALHRRLASRTGEGVVLNNVADLRLERGDLDGAARAALDAVVALDAAGADAARATAVSTLGAIRSLQGRDVDAVENLRAALATQEALGLAPRAARTRLDLAVALHLGGALDEAAALLDATAPELAVQGEPARRVRCAVHRVGVAVARDEDELPPPIAHVGGDRAGLAWAALEGAWRARRTPAGERAASLARARAAVAEATETEPVSGSYWLRLALRAAEADLATDRRSARRPTSPSPSEAR